jgi:hypothetical protein
MEREFEFSPEYLTNRSADFSVARSLGHAFATENIPLQTLADQAEETRFVDNLQKAAPSLSHEEARLAFLAGVAQNRLGPEVGDALERHQTNKAIVDNWSGTRTEERGDQDYLALARLMAANKELARYSPDVEQVRELWEARQQVDEQIRSLSQVQDFARESYQAGRQYDQQQSAAIDFSKPPTLYSREAFECGVQDQNKERTVPEISKADEGYRGREEQEAAPERLGVSVDWLRDEAETIKVQAEWAVDAGVAATHAAYVNGRRDAFNELRMDILDGDPGREKDLPPAIQIDEIQVRQKVLEQEQSQENALRLAR